VSETLLDRVAAAAAQDPDAINPVLQVLVGDVVEHPPALRPVAVSMNGYRREGALAEFMRGSWTTEELLREVTRFQTRQAVHALRSRGRLAGRTIGNATWFPRWQFSDADLRPDLGNILEALRRFSTDAVACDRIMRLPREELRGRSIAESLDRPSKHRLAWRLLDAVGGAD
jgi:hypothetical protein